MSFWHFAYKPVSPDTAAWPGHRLFRLECLHLKCRGCSRVEERWNIRSLGNNDISTRAGIPASPSPAFLNPRRSQVENHFSHPILAQGCATSPKPQRPHRSRGSLGDSLLELGAHGIATSSLCSHRPQEHPPPAGWGDITEHDSRCNDSYARGHFESPHSALGP